MSMTVAFQSTDPIYKNSFSTLVIRGAVGLSRLLMLVLIARSYGPTPFGQLTLALSFIEIFRTLGDFGLDTITIRRIASEPQGTDRVMNASLTFKVLSASGVLLPLVLIFGALYGFGDGLLLLLALIPTLFTSLVLNSLTGYFQARLKMSEIVGAYVIGVCCYVGLTLLFLLLGAPLPVVVGAFVGGELLTIAFVARRYITDFPIHPKIHVPLIRELLRQSSFVALSSVLVMVYLRIDTLMIGSMLGDREVGEYALAFRLIEPFQLVFASLSLSLFASLSGRWRFPDPAQIRRLIGKAALPALGLAVLGSFVLSVGGPPFVRLFASEFSESGNVLIFLSLALVFKSINPQLTAILNSLGKFRLLAVVTLVNLSAGIVLNMILLPRYGVLGAALTVVSVECFNCVLQAILAWVAIRRQLEAKIS